jgi:hypothetical protein
LVTVTNGMAFCEGSLLSDDHVDDMTGTGLFQLFFQHGLVYKYDPAFDQPAATEAEVRAQSAKEKKALNPSKEKREPVYSFVFACPQAGSADRTAYWNHSRESNNQPRPPGVAASAKCKADPACYAASDFPPMLCGSWEFPNGATDAENGVTGVVYMTWRLCRDGCKVQPRNYDAGKDDLDFRWVTQDCTK